MAERVIFPEFRDENEVSRYPFADTASLTTEAGDHTIDRDTFLDASLHPIGARARVFLSKITVSSQAITLAISDDQDVELAAGEFNPVDPPSVIRLTDSYGREAGVLVSEPLRLAAFTTWRTGEHTFSSNATEFVASVVIPMPELGLRGILTEAGEILTGDVWILGDRGVVVRDDSGRIRIDIVGDPLFARRLCYPIDRFAAPLFIRTINGCPPDEYGNFDLNAMALEKEDTIVRFYPVADGIQIEAVGRLATKG